MLGQTKIIVLTCSLALAEKGGGLKRLVMGTIVGVAAPNSARNKTLAGCLKPWFQQEAGLNRLMVKTQLGFL